VKTQLVDAKKLLAKPFWSCSDSHGIVKTTLESLRDETTEEQENVW